MAITGREFELEERRLVEVSKLLDDQLAKMGENIFEDEEKFQEFKRYSWENKRTMDSAELSQVNSQSELEANMLLMKRDYFKKLYRIKDNPYFASIIFEDEDKFMEFRRYTWDNMRAMDAQELNQATVESEFDANKIFI